MDQQDQDFIQAHLSDPELKSAWEEHVLLSKQVEKLESKAFRNPEDEQTLKNLKKQKLDAKTRLADRVDALRAAQ